MALTDIQRRICRLLSANRIENGESYVAGGVALNTLLDGSRISRDVDLFHDTEQALVATWEADRLLLCREGFTLETVRERPSYVEMIVALVVLILFTFFGDWMLKVLGISRETIAVAGGTLLFLISLTMIFPDVEKNT